MNPRKALNKVRLRRKRRTKAKIYGTAERPRFSIFRSNRYTYVQLIDDEKGKTLVSASTRESKQLGELIAKKAIEKGIKKVVFDRGRYKYHGRVKSVVEEARKGGLQL